MKILYYTKFINVFKLRKEGEFEQNYPGRRSEKSLSYG